MMRMLVIGYGNTLRGDDGIGYLAAQELRRTVNNKDVRIIACQQLTPELSKDASDAERVVLIDATRRSSPGNITTRKILPTKTPPTFTHELSPETLLACSQELYATCPETFLISVTGKSFQLGEGLSHQVAKVKPELIRQILKLLDMRQEKTCSQLAIDQHTKDMS